MPALDYRKLSEQAFNNLLNDEDISAKNKADFKEYMQGIEVSHARIQIISIHIRHLFRAMPDVIGSMHDRKVVNAGLHSLKKELSKSYLEDIKKVGKAFVRWHNSYKTPDGWIDVKSIGKKNRKRDLNPEDMITWEDGLKLSKAAQSIQWQALILTQLDGGFRPSELCDLNYGDVKFRKDFAVVHVARGKTGKRDVILYRSVPYLQRWLRNHPKKDKDSPLWLQEQRTKVLRRYEYYAIIRRLKRLAKKVNLNKPVDLYNFRHSACYMSKMDNVSTELAARKFGHSVEFYVSTYARLSPDDDIKRYSKLYKLEKTEQEEEAKPVRCVKCNTINEPGVGRCQECGMALTKEEAKSDFYELQNLKERLNKQDEQMARLLLEVHGLKEIKNELNRRENVAHQKY